MKKIRERHIILASHNTAKLAEMTDALHMFGYVCYSARDRGAGSCKETGTTFRENAALKARKAAVFCNAPAIADDSGLCVAALQGAPGIYSARWAGFPQNYRKAFAAIEELLAKDPTDGTFIPKAHFECAIAIAWPNNHVELFDGKVYGRLQFPPRGKGGFGYDSIFVPDGYQQTFAEMSSDEKNRISHRTLAIEEAINNCATEPI